LPPVVPIAIVIRTASAPAFAVAAVAFVVARIVVTRIEVHDVCSLLLWVDNADMLVASGKVVNGRVEVDADLPEGASVTVLVLEGDGTFEADPETEQMLLEAISQCRRNETTPLARFLDELRQNE